MTVPLEGVPSAIGPFRVLRAIARGGMAEVYEVEHPDTREHLALKLLVDRSESARRRFDREYAVMNALNHPNIVRVYRYGLHHEQPWMSMELVEGTPIQAFARDQGRAGTERRTRELLRVSYDVAHALDHIHTRGLLHRDLKSANLLVLSDGRVKLFDFGAARFLAGDENITADREFLGTFAYASPEQLQNRELDHRSDIYSFGVLLYRLFTAKRPFWSDSPHELARMHVQDAPLPPTERVPLPDGLERLILDMLAKDPEDRPQACRQVAERLQACSDQQLGGAPELQIGPRANRVVGREEQLAALRGFVFRHEQRGGCALVGAEGSGLLTIRHAAVNMLKEGPSRVVRQTFELGTDVAVWTALLDGLGIPAEQVVGGLAAGAAAFAGVVADALEEADADGLRPVVMVLHDLHLADARSLDLLGALLPRLTLGNASLLVDWTTGEQATEARLLDHLPGLSLVRLDPLSPLGVARFVGALLHRRPPPIGVAQRIHAATGGLPEHVESTVEALVEQKKLKLGGPHGLFVQWSGDETLEIPLQPSARAALVSALERLPIDHLRVLEALAVIDAQVPAAVLAQMLDRTEADVRHTAALLTQLSWLRDEEHGLVWQHALARQLVVDRLKRSRRELLERRALEAVESLDEGPARVRWLVRADRREEAEQLALRVARRALDVDDPLTALQACRPLIDSEAANATGETVGELHLRHAQAMLVHSPDKRRIARALLRARAVGPGSDPVYRARLFLARARAWRTQGHYANSRKYLDRAWREAKRAEHAELEGTVAAAIGQVCQLLGRTSEAARWFDLASEHADADPRVAAAALAGQGSVCLARGDLRGAIGFAEQAMAGGDVLGISLGLPVLLDAHRLLGSFSEGLTPLYRHLPGVRRVQAPRYLVEVLLAASRCEVEIGRLGRAQEHVDELAATLRSGEDLHLRVEMGLVQARILLDSDEVEEAWEVLDDLLPRAVEPGLLPQVARTRALMAEAAWRRRDAALAEELFDEARRGASVLSDRVVDVEVARAQARVDEVTDPDAIFAGLETWANDQQVELVRMCKAIAHTRWLGQTDRPVAIESARAVLARVESQQETTDAIALRVHPWGRHLNALREIT